VTPAAGGWRRRARRLAIAGPFVLLSLLGYRGSVVFAFGDLDVEIGGITCPPNLPPPPGLLPIPNPVCPDNVIVAGAQTAISTITPTDPQQPEDRFIVVVRNEDIDVTNPPSEPVVFEYRAPKGVVITGIRAVVLNTSGLATYPCEVGTSGDPSDPTICELGQLAPTVGNAVITIEYYVDRGTERDTLLDHDVRAYLTPIGTDANEADNQDHAFTSVTTRADLTVIKTGPSCPFPFFPNTMKAGQCDVFKLAVKNKGPSNAFGVFVADEFFFDPLGGMRITNAEVVDTLGGTCAIRTRDGVQNSVLCDLGDILAGDVRKIDVTMCADSDVPDGKNFLNVAAVGSGDLPPPLGLNPLIPPGLIPQPPLLPIDLFVMFPFTPEPCVSLLGITACLNNLNVLPIIVNSEADLAIEKTAEPDKVFAGEQNVYTIKVTNNGPSDVLNPMVRDFLPPGLDYEIDDDNCFIREHQASDPDPFGYVYTDTNLDHFLTRDGIQNDFKDGMGNPTQSTPLPYNANDPGEPFFDIAGSGTAIGGIFNGGPDDGSVNVPIGFDFQFYDLVENNLYVSTNGYLKFSNDGDAADPDNDCPLSASTPNRSIYVFWDDLSVTGGNVYYDTFPDPSDPTQSVFVVQWDDVLIKASGDRITFQVQLYEKDHVIRMVYGDGVGATPAAGGESATVGIEPRFELVDEDDGGITYACGDDGDPADPFVDENFVIEFHDGPLLEDELICFIGTPVKAGSVPAYVEGTIGGLDAPSCIQDLFEFDFDFNNITFSNDKVFTFPDGSTVTHIMKPGEMRSFEVRSLVDPSIKPNTIITNTAVVTGYTTLGDPTTMIMADNFQPFGGDNTGTVKSTVLNKADLHITKFGKPDRGVLAGEVLTYTIVVDNLGPSWADNVAIKDILQSSGTFDLIDIHSDRRARCNGLPGPRDELIRPSEWPINRPPPTGVDDDTGVRNVRQRLELDCVLEDDPDTIQGANSDADLDLDGLGMEQRLEVLAADGPPNSGRWILTLRVRAAETQSINNIADVLSDAEDPNTDNNHAEVQHDIIDNADVEISKTDSGDPFVAGTEFDYVIKVTNHGPSTAENVEVVDTLPLGLTIVSMEQPGDGSCATVQGVPGNLQVRCTLGFIRPDDERDIRITVRIDPDMPDGAILWNQAVVTTSILDTDNSNNVTRARSLVIARADIGVEKIDEPDPVVAGQDLQYRITVRNDGPSNARDVVVVDDLPDNVKFVSAQVVQGAGACLPLPAGSVTCQLGKVEVGKVVEIVLTVNVHPDTPCDADLTNNVVVTSETADPTPNRRANTDQRRTSVSCEAALSIRKTASTNTPVAGSQFAYTIAVTNNGPSVAEDVTVKDNLGPDMNYVLDTFGCGSGSLLGAGCALGDLQVGQTVTFDLVVELEADAACGSTIPNTVEADSPTSPRVEATANIVVACQSDLAIYKFGKPDDEVLAGEELRYYVLVNNRGPSDSPPNSVVVRDLFASDGAFTITRISSSRPATCRVGSGPVFGLPFNGAIQGNRDLRLSCTLGVDLNPSEQWRLEIDATASEAQTLNNVADVLLEHPVAVDPDESNNHAEVAHDIADVADLAITKGDGNDPVHAGERFEYTLDVVNRGPSPAENVVVVDTLPFGLKVVDLDQPPGGACGLDQPSGGAVEITCRLGDLAATEERRITFDVQVAGTLADGSVVWNQATVDSDVFDPNRGDNLDRARTPIGAEADLEITKTDAPDPVVAGERLSYHLRVFNHGPSQAENVVVTDDLPGGFLFDTAATLSGRGICQPLPAGFVTCTIPSIPAFAGEEIVIEGIVDPATPCTSTLVNAASVSSDTPEPGGGGLPNAAGQSTMVECQARLVATKSASTRTPAAGSDFSYTVTVTNAGPSVAEAVTVKDVLPPFVTYVLDTRGCGAQLTGAGCEIGDLAPGETVSFDIVVHLDAEAPCRTVLTNTALVTSPMAQAVVAMADVAVDCAADLRVLKFGKPDGAVRAGEVLTYTIVVDNLGPSFAEGVFVKDIMESSGVFSLLSVESDRDALCVTEPPVWADIAGHIELGCTLNDPLAVLQENGSVPNPGRWIIKVKVVADETQDINNVADVGAARSRDPNPANNRAVVEHAITDVADLSITKTDNDAAEPFKAGTSFSYDITVRNNGPSAAENVQVIDTLPIGLSPMDLGDGCASAPLPTGAIQVTCNLGTIAKGAEEVITLDVFVAPDVPSGTMLWNQAIVLSDIFDPDNRNNIARTPSRIGAEADLGIVKTDDPDPVTAGDRVQYLLTVTNYGPSVARDVVVSDDVPSAVTVVSAAALSGRGICQPLPAGFVTCHFDQLAPGASETIAVLVEVSPVVSCSADLVNRATISSTTAEPAPDPHANSATASTDVSCRARLVATKVASTFTPVAGGDLVYKLSVRNLGPSIARNLSVVDTLPAGLTYVLDTRGCGASLFGAGCALGDLAPGDAVTFDIVVRVAPDAACDTVLSNSARFRASSADPVVARADVRVDCVADLRVVKIAKPDGNVRGGGVVTYTVIVDNLGPSFAQGVNLYDFLQSSGTFDVIGVDSSRPAQCTSEPDPAVGGEPFGVPPIRGGVAGVDRRYQLACTLTGPLAVLKEGDPSGAGRWVVTVQVKSDAEQDLNNLATVSSTVSSDPETSNNQTEIVKRSIVNVADLSITKTDGGAQPNAGETFSYVLTITNHGPSTASDVRVVDSIPSGLAIVDIDDPVGGTCATTQGSGGGGEVRCNLGVLKPSDPPRVVRIHVRVNPNVRDGVRLINQATVTAAEPDPNTANNLARETTPVGEVSELVVTKDASPKPVTAGQIVNYAITVRNDGPSVAINVQLEDQLGSNGRYLTFLGANFQGGSGRCYVESLDDPDVRCTLGDLGVGARVRIDMQLVVDPGTAAGTVFVNNVELDAESPITVSGDVTEEVTVGALQDVTISKVASDPSPVAGADFRYTIEVVNHGPSSAYKVRVADDLAAAGVRFLSSTSNRCTESPNHVVNCDFGAMAPGAKVVFDLAVRIPPDFGCGAPLANRATVTWDPANDSDPANDRTTAAVETVPVDCVSDVRVVKIAKPDGPVPAGTPLEYTITIDNLGPSFAEGARSTSSAWRAIATPSACPIQAAHSLAAAALSRTSTGATSSTARCSTPSRCSVPTGRRTAGGGL